MHYTNKLISILLKNPMKINIFNTFLKDNDTFFNNIELEKDLLLSNGVPLYFSNDKVYLETTTTKIEEQVFCVVDIETSAGNIYDGQIIEIGAVKIKNGKIIERYESLVNTNKIPHTIEEITGINVDITHKAPSLMTVLEEFKIFLENDIFVSHPLSFDYKFINDSLKQHNLGELFNRKLCTINLAKRTIKAQRYGLKYLKEDLNINVNGLHRAYEDALSSMYVLEKSLDNIPINIQYTEELLDFSLNEKGKNKI
jgi:DNA polymerase-3 subunit epsilon